MFSNNDDLLLQQQLQAGNMDAFNAFYKRFRTDLTVYALSILENEAEAQDVVQEFFITFWERKLYANITTSIKSFLYVSIKNRCLNRLRDNDTRIRHLQEIQLEEGYTLPEEMNERQALQQELSQTIKNEAPLCSEIFKLAYFEGLSYKQIAETMDISPHTVRNQLVRALKILRGKVSRKFIQG
jgi:RNA polymerase sigma-70 factor (ECF subfamily)